ncbi:MAG: hypothetical protein JOZ38_08090 [Candidatus Eremiobacteraeota bacterium]|nr:hypothetical protein [Candidatus Eremiobacteraeota bacterium]
MSAGDLLSLASAGMQAQRAALDVAARNVAAAEVAGPRGSYPRQVPEFRLDTDGAVRFIGARTLRGSSVDALAEMVSVLNASRAYEADATVFDTGKRLLERTIDVERL